MLMVDAGDHWWFFALLQCPASASCHRRQLLSDGRRRVGVRPFWGSRSAHQETAHRYPQPGRGSWRRLAQVLLSAGAQVPAVERRRRDYARALHVLAILHRLPRRRAATSAARELPSKSLHRHVAPPPDPVALDPSDGGEPRCLVPWSSPQRNACADRAACCAGAAASDAVDIRDAGADWRQLLLVAVVAILRALGRGQTVELRRPIGCGWAQDGGCARSVASSSCLHRCRLQLQPLHDVRPPWVLRPVLYLPGLLRRAAATTSRVRSAILASRISTLDACLVSISKVFRWHYDLRVSILAC